MDDPFLLKRLRAWAAKQGTALPPAVEPGTVWYVPNEILGIKNKRTTEHPCIVIHAPPTAQLLKGTHDKVRWGKDAATIALNQNNMDKREPGKGLDLALTYFNLSDIMPLALADEQAPGRYIGKLSADALKNVMMRIEDSGIDF